METVLSYEQMKHQTQNICIVNNPATKAGRDRLSGILRFISEKPEWRVRIISSAIASTPPELKGRTIGDTGFKGVIGYEGELQGIFCTNWNPDCRIPHVTLDTQLCGSHSEHVIVRLDEDAVARSATTLFAKRGLLHVAYVGNDADTNYEGDIVFSRERAEAFRRQAKVQGLETDQFEESSKGNWVNYLERLSKWLESLPHPCGVLAYNDEHARLVMDACRLAHLHIPGQIQLIGVDNDIAVCETLQPTLTSIQPNFEGSGYLAARELDDMIKNGCPKATKFIHYGVKDVIERASTQDIKGGGRLVMLAREHMRCHSHEPITVSDIAVALNISRSTLEHRFREVLGRGVAEVLRQYRLDHACQLLRSTTRSVNDISCDIGFDSPNHLKAAFKKAYGMTMKEWREQNIHSV